MHPRSLRFAAIVVAVLTVASAGGSYVALSRAAAQAATCSLSTTNSIVIDQPEQPDSLDPAVAYTTPGWGAVQQVYQTMVFYNNTQFGPTSGPNYMAPLLARNWSTSADGIHWNFTLWPQAHFSNGDPVNAYVMWYSLYRGMVMNQPLAYLLEENFFLPGHTYGAVGTNYTQYWMAGLLNSMNTVASVTNPSASLLAVMAAKNQSFRVLDATTIQLNIGNGSVDYKGPAPYPFLLDQVATPGFAAVDPVVVAANGGVSVNAPSSWMANNMLGSGPYNLTFWSPTTGYSLTPNKNYWATSLATQLPNDNNIQPAKMPIDVSFQQNPTIVVQNMKTGAAALGSFAYIGPSLINQLKGVSCLVVHALPPVFGGLSFSGWIYMDQQPNVTGEPKNPFTNQWVRNAVVHAIDYNQIISVAFGGNANKWVGPIPPGFPDYNTGNVPNYTFDLGKAERAMNNSSWPMATGGLNNLYPNGLNFEYLQTGDWNVVAQLLKADLAKVDIPINPVALSIPQLVVEQYYNGVGQCVSATGANGGPFYIGLDYYTGDYVGPDDPTELNAWSQGGYNICMSEFKNSTVDQWFYQAAEATNPAVAAQAYGNITQFMASNYTNAWLVVPTSFQVYNSLLTGIIGNPMGSAIGFQLIYNTDHTS
ncbi:MAG: ABC transporter substrate-binding protein [Thermoplasmata archaeon]|nr:ABC transporter substrate-binding protein [Thermoplasmata archaeon]